MRVSAGFLVMGLSGNSRIQTLPPRLMERVIAMRAASISRSVTHPHSSALRPKSPKATEEPRHALPHMRPRCCFLYFTFFGIIMAVRSLSLLTAAFGFLAFRFFGGRLFDFRLLGGRRRGLLARLLLPGRLLRRHQRRQNGDRKST